MLSDVSLNRNRNSTSGKYVPVGDNINKRLGYQSYMNGKKTITGSPYLNDGGTYLSPNISPQQSNFRRSTGFPVSDISDVKNHLTNHNENIPCEVYMPGGIKYNANQDFNKPGTVSTKIRGKLSGSPKYQPYTPSKSRRSETFSEISQTESSHYDSDNSNNDEINSHLSSKEQKRREKKIQEKMIMKMLIRDYLDRTNKEKETKNNENKNYSPSNPGFEIPKSEEPKKDKIPNYDILSEIDKDKIREKFRSNYNLLMIKYPNWKIEMPDFNLLPLRLIHERYESVVKTICIYQTAMKWKVYFFIALAIIEYYGCKKGYTFLQGLLKAQLKTIYKYDTYLIEFSQQYYTDEQGEDYPLYQRILFTFFSGLGTFSTINGFAKAFLGNSVETPDYIFEQADKFVSPPEGTAKLHSDGISDVPEPPEGYQNPDNIMNGLEYLFSLFTGQVKKEKRPTQQVQEAQEAGKPKEVDDFENAEF